MMVQGISPVLIWAINVAYIVQAVVLVLGVLIYMPFVKVNDRVMERQAAQAEEEDDDSVFDLD